MIDFGQLKKDFTVFADPVTNVDMVVTEKGATISLLREGKERRYNISMSDGRVVGKHTGGKSFPSVSSLFASEEFSDIRTFRATQRRILASKKVWEYIEPEGIVIDGGKETALNLGVFRKITLDSPPDNLSILLIDGPAGVGKTSLLERMVYERTDPSVTAPPLLHVTSGGSRLTDLNKALAQATQLLRSSITFDQVPILVRCGVLQVAIDGFDELIDPDGYKDAWSALRGFLHEVREGGPIILAGRDTFFDQQSFEDKITKQMATLRVISASLTASSPAVARAYLLGKGWDEQEVQSAESNEWLKNGTYRLRPFFLSQIAVVSGWKELHEAHGSPQSFLVSRFVRREAELITRMIAISIEAAETSLLFFYGMIAEDMVSNEQDSVDEGYLALACETAFSGIVEKDDLSKITYKAASLGLMESVGRRELRQFPHFEIQNQFLVRSVIDGLKRKGECSVFLRRGTVNMAISEAFSDVYEEIDHTAAEIARGNLYELRNQNTFSERLQANINALLIASLSRRDISSGEVIGPGNVLETRLIGSLSPAVISSLTINRLDARGANCQEVTFKDCNVGVLTVDDLSLFGTTYPNVQTCIQIEEMGKMRAIRDRAVIEEWFIGHSLSERNEVDKEKERPFVKYFDRLCRRFVRQHQIRDSVNEVAYSLLCDKYWEEAVAILGERLVREKREAKGSGGYFYRIVRPEELLNRSSIDDEAKCIWRKVYGRAQEI